MSFLPVKEYIPKSSNNNTTKAVNIPSEARRVSLNSLDDKENTTENGYIRSKSVPNHLFHGKSVSEDNESDETEAKLTDIRESFPSGDFAGLERESSTDGDLTNSHVSEKGDSDKNSTKQTDKSNGWRQNVKNMQDVLRLSRNGGEVPSLLPQISEPVPQDWVTIEEDFVTICATYQTHLGSDLIMAPDAHFNDGIIHLCFIKSGIQKAELISLMGLLEKGMHIDHPSPNIEFIKCLAFRIDPETSDGVIMVDGEKVDSTVIQGQVLPGISNLMAIQ